MKLLHLDASILGDHSVSRQLSAAVVSRLRSSHPGIAVTYRDLSTTPLGHLSGAHLAAGQGVGPANTDLQNDIAAGTAALEALLDADILVIGVPMYNFSVPTQLKAWIDRVLVAGKTFRYTEKGPEGLAGNKRVIVALSRGGFYGAETSMASFEHAESYLRSVFSFIGITNPEFVLAEGVLVGPEQRDKAIASALGATLELKAA